MIKLTARSGEAFYLNPEFIVSFMARDGGGSEIDCSESTELTSVVEGPDEIVEMIEGWERRKRMRIQLAYKEAAE